MKLLLNDYVQKAQAPPSLKTAALTDRLTESSISIIFSETPDTISHVGIGGTDAKEFCIDEQIVPFQSSGLYELPRPITGKSKILITHDGTYVGRIALGKALTLGISPMREPGYKTTHTPRKTLSGQIVPGVSGYNFRTVDVDVRYGITKDFFTDLHAAYEDQIAKNLPFFVYFGQTWLPFDRLYAILDPNMTFQSSYNGLRYSQKFSFEEVF